MRKQSVQVVFDGQVVVGYLLLCFGEALGNCLACRRQGNDFNISGGAARIACAGSSANIIFGDASATPGTGNPIQVDFELLGEFAASPPGAAAGALASAGLAFADPLSAAPEKSAINASMAASSMAASAMMPNKAPTG
jgi:hypothetical protein